jgi:hypothetical protein
MWSDHGLLSHAGSRVFYRDPLAHALCNLVQGGAAHAAASLQFRGEVAGRHAAAQGMPYSKVDRIRVNWSAPIRSVRPAPADRQ